MGSGKRQEKILDSTRYVLLDSFDTLFRGSRDGTSQGLPVIFERHARLLSPFGDHAVEPALVFCDDYPRVMGYLYLLEGRPIASQCCCSTRHLAWCSSNVISKPQLQ